MKIKSKVILSLFTAISILSLAGCSTLKSAGQSVSNDVGSILNYKNGVEISSSTLLKIKNEHMTKIQVEKEVGHPVSIEKVGSHTYWKYPFTEIKSLGENTNVTNVIVFDNNGYAIDAYQAQGVESNSGNALVNAANGL